MMRSPIPYPLLAFFCQDYGRWLCFFFFSPRSFLALRSPHNNFSDGESVFPAVEHAIPASPSPTLPFSLGTRRLCITSRVRIPLHVVPCTLWSEKPDLLSFPKSLNDSPPPPAHIPCEGPWSGSLSLLSRVWVSVRYFLPPPPRPHHALFFLSLSSMLQIPSSRPLENRSTGSFQLQP